VIGVAHQVHDFAGNSLLRGRIKLLFARFSAARARGERATAAEKVTATVNFNSFEVPSEK
jgi:hypothetical protein